MPGGAISGEHCRCVADGFKCHKEDAKKPSRQKGRAQQFQGQILIADHRKSDRYPRNNSQSLAKSHDKPLGHLAGLAGL